MACLSVFEVDRGWEFNVVGGGVMGDWVSHFQNAGVVCREVFVLLGTYPLLR